MCLEKESVMWSFLMLMCLTLHMTGINAESYEARLFTDLLKNHNPNIRPVNNHNETVLVTFGAAIQLIAEMSWPDLHMRWDPDIYGGVSKLVVPLERIWKPDIVLYNNVDLEYAGLFETDPILTSSGTVYWNTPTIFKSSCTVDVSFFPFDVQHCLLKFGSWAHSGLLIDLTNRSVSGDTSTYIENGEWELLDMSVKRNVRYYKCCKEPYPDITFTIVIRRMPQFYLFNLMLPCIILSVVTALNFLLPADSGEKIGFALTALLALIVFLLLVAETIPPSSQKIPLIGQYFVATIFITAMSAAMSVFVLHLHYQLPGAKPVPMWLKKFVFVYLSPILGSMSHNNGKPIPPSIMKVGPSTILEENNNLHLNCGLENKTRNVHLRTSNVEQNPSVSALEQTITSIDEHLTFLIERYNDHDGDEDILTQWKYVACALDRLFLYVYIILTLVSTVVIIGQPKQKMPPD